MGWVGVLKSQKNKPAHNRRDFTGLSTEYLTAIEYIRSKNNRSMWTFQCKCGIIKEISAYRVANGVIRSCGCMKNSKKPQSFIKRMYHIYKRGASSRGYDFLLTIEQFFSLAKSKCFYCDQSPEEGSAYSYLINKYSTPVNGIDRMDNSMGYTEENCVSCCKSCNKMKMDLNKQDFIDRCKKIIDNLSSKKK